jgi:hypothetical protein
MIPLRRRVPRLRRRSEVPARQRQVAGVNGIGGPPLRRRQPHAAVQARRVPALASPGGGGVLKLLPDEQAGPVLVDPPAQPGPAAQQRLVGDLHRVPAGGQQPRGGERVQRGPRSHRVGHAPEQAVRRDPTPGVGGPVPVPGGLADPDQAEEDLPGGRLPRLVEPGVDVVGRPGDGARDPARCLVACDRQPTAVAVLPGRAQGMGQQGKPPRLVAAARALAPVRGPVAARAQVLAGTAALVHAEIAQQPLGEPGLQRQAHRPRGTDDRLPHLGGRHRPHNHLPGLHRLAQHPVRGGLRVEVGPHAEHHQGAARAGVSGQGPDLIKELGTLPFRLADREDLLKLVDDHDETPVAGDRLHGREGGQRRAERLQRVGPWCDH